MTVLKPPLPPMEARAVKTIPTGGGWQYEPKWDGFRCLAFRSGRKVELQSKSGQPLGRYFPEVVKALTKLKPTKFVLDGEIVVPVDGQLSFDALLLRLHPAESRVRKLSTETPAEFIIFDLLRDADGRALIACPLEERRQRLDAFARKHLKSNRTIHLSPATRNADEAQSWFDTRQHDLDGVVAKRLDMPYRSGERDAMQKVKRRQTADCVVGGFRYASKEKIVGSLLLGLYDRDGLLHHVGFTSSMKGVDKKELTKQLERLRKPVERGGGFSGRAPGGPSRWATERSSEWEPLQPKLVVEVEWDHFTGGRFRHGTKFMRWRPDKSPRQCTPDQVKRRKV